MIMIISIFHVLCVTEASAASLSVPSLHVMSPLRELRDGLLAGNYMILPLCQPDCPPVMARCLKHPHFIFSESRNSEETCEEGKLCLKQAYSLQPRYIHNGEMRYLSTLLPACATSECGLRPDLSV